MRFLIVYIVVIITLPVFATHFDDDREEFARSLGAEIAKDPLLNLEGVLQRAADFRREMARRDRDEEADNFGVRRFQIHIVTPIGGYPIAWFLMQNYVREADNEQVIIQQVESEGVSRPASYPILGTRTSLVNLGGRGRNNLLAPYDPSRLLAEAQNAFQNSFMLFERPIGELRENLARLHYRLAVAQPYRRGSAAIAEMVLEALISNLGLNISYPDFSRVVAAISRVRGIDTEQVRFELGGLQGYATLGSALGGVQGRVVLDQFAHGSSSEDEFVRFYAELVHIRDEIGFTRELPEPEQQEEPSPATHLVRGDGVSDQALRQYFAAKQTLVSGGSIGK